MLFWSNSKFVCFSTKFLPARKETTLILRTGQEHNCSRKLEATSFRTKPLNTQKYFDSKIWFLHISNINSDNTDSCY